MGLTINLEFVQADNPTQSFKNSIQAAANLLDAAIADNITVNLSIGYGEVQGTPLTNGSAASDDGAGYNLSYSSLRALLASHEESAADIQSVNALPNTATLNGVSQFNIGTAEAKALGVVSATNPAIDGYAGFARNIPSSLLVGVALHELTHALGRVPGASALALFRYTSPGNHLFTDNTPAASSYFSINGGNTDLADFGVSSDPSDFLNPPNSNLTPNDPFNEFYSFSTLQSLTAIDLTVLDVLGFDLTGPSPTPPTPPAPTYPAISDFNGDGKSDVLFKTAGGSIPIWLMNGSQIAAASFTNANGGVVGVPGPGWNIVDTTGDFDGDGKSDILWQTATQVAIWEMNGAQIKLASYTTIGSSPVGVPAPGWAILGAADFNGDGDSDILWQTGNGSPAIWEMNGTQIAAAGYTTLGSSIVGAPGSDWHIIGSGDFDGDGDSDILWRTDGGALAIWEMNGTQIKSADFIRQGTQAVGAPGPDWHLITTGDFDGDGKSDLLWETNAGRIAIWEMSGTQIKSAGYVQAGSAIAAAPGGWTLAGAADVNGDGKADLLWQTGTGQVAVWEMNGFSVIAADYVRAGSAPAGTGLDWSIAQHSYNYV